MRILWQELLELVWPSRYDPIASRKHRIALLEVFLAVVIALAAGPEIYAAMEMTALMELLGGLLFLTAMSAGAKLVVLDVWNVIRRISFPVPVEAIIRPTGSVPARLLGCLHIAVIALWSWALALSCRYAGSLDYPHWRA